MPKVKAKKKCRSIGVENESSLHRDLKLRYAGKGGRTEERVSGFICDCVSEAGEFVEVQTGNFAPLKKKVEAFAAKGRVRIIHPIAVQKFVELYDTEHNRLYRKKSPMKGTPWDVFRHLIRAPLLPLTRRLTIELVLADIVEKRVQDGKGSRHREGASILDRCIICLHETVILKGPAAYRRFIPFAKGEAFTAKALAQKAKTTIHMARRCLYVLTRIGVVEKTGKEGKAFVYTMKSRGTSRKNQPAPRYLR
ncbi:MAG: hypothetical protein MdMp014T_1715 [Treponematales bacterium]